MSRARFPSSHMILPEFRHVSLQPQIVREPITRIKNRQEFQRLIELSLQAGIVLQLITHSDQKDSPRTTTGIVKHINPHTGTIIIHTLEGTRFLHSRDVCDISGTE